MEQKGYIKFRGALYQKVSQEELDSLRTAYEVKDALTLFKSVLKGLGSIGSKLKKPDESLLGYLDEYIASLEKIRNMLGQTLFKESLK